jgi:hypothetical protein
MMREIGREKNRTRTMPIERTKVEIRAGVVFGPVCQVCHEDGVRDEGRISECEGGGSSTVFLDSTALE